MTQDTLPFPRCEQFDHYARCSSDATRIVVADCYKCGAIFAADLCRPHAEFVPHSLCSTCERGPMMIRSNEALR